MPVFTKLDIDFEVQDAENLKSLSCNGSMHPRFRELLPEILDCVKQDGLFTPVVGYEIQKVASVKPGIFSLHDGDMLHSPLLTHKLARASHLVFGVASIGRLISDAVTEFFSTGKHLRAFVLEEVANALLFRTSEHLYMMIENQAAGMGLTASGPASPGDIDGFDISQQRTVLSLAGADRTGITLTSTNQMDPVHSLSVVVGMGDNLMKWTRADNCNICRARDKCVHRHNFEETPA